MSVGGKSNLLPDLFCLVERLQGEFATVSELILRPANDLGEAKATLLRVVEDWTMLLYVSYRGPFLLAR